MDGEQIKNWDLKFQFEYKTADLGNGLKLWRLG